jgi:hypothetical protein
MLRFIDFFYFCFVISRSDTHDLYGITVEAPQRIEPTFAGNAQKGLFCIAYQITGLGYSVSVDVFGEAYTGAFLKIS